MSAALLSFIVLLTLHSFNSCDSSRPFSGHPSEVPIRAIPWQVPRLITHTRVLPFNDVLQQVPYSPCSRLADQKTATFQVRESVVTGMTGQPPPKHSWLEMCIIV